MPTDDGFKKLQLLGETYHAVITSGVALIYHQVNGNYMHSIKDCEVIKDPLIRHITVY